jgi:hypothetical protein
VFLQIAASTKAQSKKRKSTLACPGPEEYPMDRPKVGAHDIINTLHDEQPATRKDVDLMKTASTLVGLEVSTTRINPTIQMLESLCVDLSSRDFSDFNCYFMTAICHGEAVIKK